MLFRSIDLGGVRAVARKSISVGNYSDNSVPATSVASRSVSQDSCEGLPDGQVPLLHVEVALYGAQSIVAGLLEVSHLTAACSADRYGFLAPDGGLGTGTRSSRMPSSDSLVSRSMARTSESLNRPNSN